MSMTDVASNMAAIVKETKKLEKAVLNNLKNEFQRIQGIEGRFTRLRLKAEAEESARSKIEEIHEDMFRKLELLGLKRQSEKRSEDDWRIITVKLSRE